MHLVRKTGVLSPLCARSGECFEKVKLRGVELNTVMNKISYTEFIADSLEGHLCILCHQRGSNLQETAHFLQTRFLRTDFVLFHENKIVQMSTEFSTCFWDTETRRRLAVLYHDRGVCCCNERNLNSIIQL